MKKYIAILLITIVSLCAPSLVLANSSKLISCTRDESVWLYLRTPTQPYPDDVMNGVVNYSHYFANLTCRPNSWANSEANNEDIVCVGIWNHAMDENGKTIPNQVVTVKLNKNTDGNYIAHWLNTSNPNSIIRDEIIHCTLK